ncbi:MAG: hypothetical protein Fues2KO_34780 [Fuerstiella sp.]
MSSKPVPKISVVVPSYNRSHYLPGALQTLTSQRTHGRFDYEVLIVDNASTDATPEVVRQFAANSEIPVRYLHEPKPGDAPPRNAGIRAATGQWLAFFDDDQFAENDWLLNLLTAAETHQTELVGGPVHLDLNPDIVAGLSTACRSTLREMKPYADDQPYEPHVIPGTGNMLVARSLFDRIGLFVEDIKEGGSDWKLVEDARMQGVVPWYAARAVIRHRVEHNRMTSAYFRWDAENGGVSQADVDFRRFGAAGVLVRSGARFARSALLWPGRVSARINPPQHGCSQANMVAWRTNGYIRRTLTLLAPRLIPQRSFHCYVDFRSGRTIGT